MRVLVTGATGFVGFHVVKVLKNAGHQVVVLVRNPVKAQQLFAANGITVEHTVVGSVTDVRAVDDAFEGCDAVVHAAAITPLQAATEDELFATNVDGVTNVLGAASSYGMQRMVYVSSITAIFSTNANKVTPKAPIAQTTHAYGRSKAKAEEYVRALQTQRKPIKIVYPGGIIGPQDPGRSATVMSLLYRMTQRFRITSGGAQQIDVRDLAQFILRLLESNDGKPGRYLTVGHYLSWTVFADMLDEITGSPVMRTSTPGWFLRMLGHYYDLKRKLTPVPSPITAETMRYTTQWPNVRNADELVAMGVQLRTARETFTDTLRWMGETGLLDKKCLPRLFPDDGAAFAKRGL